MLARSSRRGTRLAGSRGHLGLAGAPRPPPADVPLHRGTSTPSPSPSPAPSGSSSANGFYLRAWQTQALAPQYTFAWLPLATISDGKFIDGMVAVPAIYPGPLWVGPSVRRSAPKGIDAIVAEARKQGLLGQKATSPGTPPVAGAS
jgi:hypothetical protein